MTAEYRSYYDALGLEPGAERDEVKRAYFRMVRKYPPERDPERFQTIRRAYEALKDLDHVPLEAELSPPEDRAVRRLLAQYEGCRRRGDLDDARDRLTAALSLAPDDPYLLLELARTELEMDKPRKAAKTAQRLTAMRPDLAEAHAIAAMGCYDGGWHKKSLPLFRKAYEMGTRKTDFLRSYISSADDNGQPEEADRIRRELLDNCGDKLQIEDILMLFIEELEREGIDADTVSQVLDRFEAYAKRHKRMFYDPHLIVMPVLSVLGNGLDGQRGLSVSLRAERFLARMCESFPAWRDEIGPYRVRVASTALACDDRLTCRDWANFVMLEGCDPDLEEVDARAVRYARLDIRLCMLRQREQLEADLPVIRADHPHVIEVCGETLGQLLSDDDGKLFTAMKRELDKGADRFENVRYYARYPEERPQKKNSILLHDDSGTFVRGSQKPGRNDPCPCGSGRKFKKCCLGKGIYD